MDGGGVAGGEGVEVVDIEEAGGGAEVVGDGREGEGKTETSRSVVIKLLHSQLTPGQQLVVLVTALT